MSVDVVNVLLAKLAPRSFVLRLGARTVSVEPSTSALVSSTREQLAIVAALEPDAGVQQIAHARVAKQPKAVDHNIDGLVR